MTVLIIFVGIVLAMFLPKFILKTKVSSHQQAIKSQLPDVLDLLSVCTSAGLSFDSALSKVIEKMEGPFIDELSTVFNQMQMGVPRNEAMNALSECTDIQELKTFVSAIVQANTLGIPITNVMSVQAKQLRDARRETAREKGNKAATKMALPIMLFIFPALFIVILGPVVMNVSGSLVMKKHYVKLMLNKRVICKKCEVANNPITRFKGLMFRKELEKGSALLIEPCNEIHTFNMKFPIDVVTLSKDNVVLTVFDSVPPSMVMPPVKTGRKVIELNAGDAKLLGINRGDILQIVETD